MKKRKTCEICNKPLKDSQEKLFGLCENHIAIAYEMIEAQNEPTGGGSGQTPN